MLQALMAGSVRWRYVRVDFRLFGGRSEVSMVVCKHRGKCGSGSRFNTGQ